MQSYTGYKKEVGDTKSTGIDKAKAETFTDGMTHPSTTSIKSIPKKQNSATPKKS